MTKNETAHKVADRLHMSKNVVKDVIDTLFECIYTTVEDGEKVHAGAFIFKKSVRKARKALNPNTGKIIDVPAKEFITCRVKL